MSTGTGAMVTTTTEPAKRWWTLALLTALVGCTLPDRETTAAGAPTVARERWSVTAWDARFEVFPEVDALVAGESATAHVHVTRLEDSTPLVTGAVEVVLAGPEDEQVFHAEGPIRPGIFEVEITPSRIGDFDLSFRIRDATTTAQIRGGRVRVGNREQPGGILIAPAPKGGTDGGEPLSLLKEQQWRSDFGTAWVRTGSLAGSVTGLAKARPPAGKAITVTAPVDGIVQPPSGNPWPFVGLTVRRGQPLFRVSPLIANERSLPAQEVELTGLETRLEAARGRLGRLEELLVLEAASRREVEEARVRVATLSAHHAAADRDLQAARAAREGGVSGNDLQLRAPFVAEVASVSISPGTTVQAGDEVARLVGTDGMWLEIAVPPVGARRLAAEGVRGVVLTDPEDRPIRLEEGLRLVSIAPEVSPTTGTVTVLLETPPATKLALGTVLEAQILLAEVRPGIVVPSSALVDDGGVPVVYLQLAGERFVRQTVRVLERQGDRLLVDHLTPGQRLVTRGGHAIRRASLMANNTAHGHVH